MKHCAPRLLLILVLGVVGSCAEPGEERPNIIIILADDLGYGELGCYGNDSIDTPHLDKLAANGLRFTDFHSNGAVCSPTRAALMTGQYQQRSGIEGVVYAFGPKREVGLPLRAGTVAEVMKDHGYQTGIMGKWHLGYNKEFNPVHQGFGEFMGYVSGNVDYHSHLDGVGIYDWYDQQDSLFQEGYTTDLITSNSIDFIRRHKEEPFFLYVAHEAPHSPFQTRTDPPFRLPGGDPSNVGRGPHASAKIKEMIEIMDEGVGLVMETLEELQLIENTLVFFISDNGGERIANNGPLRGHKGQLWEGGHRVPAIAYYPGRIPIGVTDATAIGMDIFPTIAAIAGADVPPDLDGVDLAPVLFKNSQLPDRALFWRYRGQKAVRMGDFKLLIAESDTSLFDLKGDLTESEDLSAAYPSLQQEYLNRLMQWESEMDKFSQITN